MLASQQLGSTMNAALAATKLAPAPEDGSIHFGDSVMLSSADGGVLAASTAHRTESAQTAFHVTRTSDAAGVACTRTTWTICPIDGAKVPEDGLLRFGMKFALSTPGADGSPLYLQSVRYTLHNLNYSGSGGKGQGVCAVPAPSADTTWSVVVLDPTDLGQMESVGQPVPANTFVALQHSNTTTNLFTHEYKVPSQYGKEREVCCLTDTSIVKGGWGKRNGSTVGVGNHWAFTTSLPEAAPASE